MAEHHRINSVYEVSTQNVDEQYKLFMIEKAKEIDLEINPNWLNVLDYDIFNSHLTKTEFKQKTKAWHKLRKRWNITAYICEVLNGVKVDYNILIY